MSGKEEGQSVPCCLLTVGCKCRVGNGINWKGQVFPKMNNFTAHNRMTGVGNALKRHYTMYLQEYEQVCQGTSACMVVVVSHLHLTNCSIYGTGVL